MSRMMRNDEVIGGSSNNASAILYVPADTNRTETNVKAELDKINTHLSVLYELDFDNKQTLPTASSGSFTPNENGIISLRSAWNGIQSISLVVDGVTLIENNSANSFVSGNAIVNAGVTYTYTGQTCVFIPFK